MESMKGAMCVLLMSIIADTQWQRQPEIRPGDGSIRSGISLPLLAKLIIV